ncbi:MAG: hypothetical protein RL338_70 [Chloroflexota bacterium]
MSRPRLVPAGAFALVVALAIPLVAGCAGGPTVGDPWVRLPMNAEGPTGAFLTISNPGSTADALLSASSPAAAAVEIHETSMGADGMMGMTPVDRIGIPAGGTVELAPGGFHLMLIGLTAPLAAGDEVELTLVFEQAGEITVTAEVREG